MTLECIPSLEQVKSAIVAPLSESYWWVTGWNFNRPVIAQLGIGAHVKDGAYVWVRFFDDAHMPTSGYKASELAGIPFRFSGPITYRSD
jgi:hypothetical protein